MKMAKNANVRNSNMAQNNVLDSNMAQNAVFAICSEMKMAKNANVICKCNIELTKVSDWFLANKLALHPKKCKFILFFRLLGKMYRRVKSIAKILKELVKTTKLIFSNMLESI